MSLAECLSGGDLVVLRSLSGGILSAVPGKDKGVWLLEKQADLPTSHGNNSDQCMPFPTTAVLTVMKTADNKSLSFRSLTAEGKVLQATKDKTAVLRFANYNFGSWEQWTLNGESLSRCKLINRQFPDKSTEICITKVASYEANIPLTPVREKMANGNGVNGDYRNGSSHNHEVDVESQLKIKKEEEMLTNLQQQRENAQNELTAIKAAVADLEASRLAMVKTEQERSEKALLELEVMKAEVMREIREATDAAEREARILSERQSAELEVLRVKAESEREEACRETELAQLELQKRADVVEKREKGVTDVEAKLSALEPELDNARARLQELEQQLDEQRRRAEGAERIAELLANDARDKFKVLEEAEALNLEAEVKREDPSPPASVGESFGDVAEFLRLEVAQLEAKIGASEKQCATLEAELGSSQSALSQTQSNLEAIVQQKSILSAEREKLEASLAALTGQVAELEVQLASKEDQLAEALASQAPLLNNRELELKGDRLLALTGQVAELENQLVSKEANFAAVSRQVAELESQLAAKEEQLFESVQRHRRAEEVADKVEAYVARADVEIQQLKGQVESLKAEKEELHAVIHRLREESAAQAAARDAWEAKQLEETNEMRKGMQMLRAEIAAKDKEMVPKAELESAQRQVKHANQEVREKLEELERQHKKEWARFQAHYEEEKSHVLMELKAKAEETEFLGSQVKKLEAEKNMLADQASFDRMQAAQYQQSLAEVQEDNNKKSFRDAAQMGQVQQLRDSIGFLERSTEFLQCQLAEKNDRVRELEESLRETSRLLAETSREVSSLREERDSLTVELLTLEQVQEAAQEDRRAWSALAMARTPSTTNGSTPSQPTTPTARRTPPTEIKEPVTEELLVERAQEKTKTSTVPRKILPDLDLVFQEDTPQEEEEQWGRSPEASKSSVSVHGEGSEQGTPKPAKKPHRSRSSSDNGQARSRRSSQLPPKQHGKPASRRTSNEDEEKLLQEAIALNKRSAPPPWNNLYAFAILLPLLLALVALSFQVQVHP